MTDFSTVDGVSSATELAQIKAGNTINLRDAFLGLQNGCIGEVCTLAILIGFAYLLIRKVISPRIPLIYMASTVVLSYCLHSLKAEKWTSQAWLTLHSETFLQAV